VIPIRKSWFVEAMQDLGWFYSALSHYAGTYRLATQKGDDAESLLLRTQSIEVVNERLGNVESRVSDATIGAVASMIAYEVCLSIITGLPYFCSLVLKRRTMDRFKLWKRM
jgi:hypothetical protein